MRYPEKVPTKTLYFLTSEEKSWKIVESAYQLMTRYRRENAIGLIGDNPYTCIVFLSDLPQFPEDSYRDYRAAKHHRHYISWGAIAS